MRIARGSLQPFDFEGLEIRDYTVAWEGRSSSLAEIVVPPSVRHATAWSRRSDKIYYVVSGALRFVVDGEAFDLRTGDACVIVQGSRFSYENASQNEARLVLVHTPSFDLSEEVLEE